MFTRETHHTRPRAKAHVGALLPATVRQWLEHCAEYYMLTQSEGHLPLHWQGLRPLQLSQPSGGFMGGDR